MTRFSFPFLGGATYNLSFDFNSATGNPSTATVATYYLLNDPTPEVVPNLRRDNGEACATIRGVALCCCGGSKNKPFCDGTHGTNGFSDKNVADSAKNRSASYVGREITIHDNRAICSHAGYCTDGLKSVFRMRGAVDRPRFRQRRSRY